MGYLSFYTDGLVAAHQLCINDSFQRYLQSCVYELASASLGLIKCTSSRKYFDLASITGTCHIAA